MTEKNPAAKEAAKETFSLEDLDQILEAEDPGFNESLNAIKKEGVKDTASIEAFAVVSKDDETNLDSAEEADKGPGGWRGNLRKKILKPVRWIRHFFSARWLAIRNRSVMFKSGTVQFVRHTLPEFLKYLKVYVAAGFKALAKGFAKAKARPKGEKFAVIGIILCAVLAGFILLRSIRQNLLPSLDHYLLKSFADEGEVIGTYKTNADYIPLFDAFPEIEFQVRLEKVTVNLLPDPDSGRVPMGLFEFYLGVDSRDTAVEIRDREKEMLDLLQRTIEGFTYTEIMSRTGKSRLKSRIRDNFNEALNQGRVMNVYLNRIVTTH